MLQQDAHTDFSSRFALCVAHARRLRSRRNNTCQYDAPALQVFAYTNADKQ